MNAFALFQTIAATRKERAFKRAVAPLLAGRQRLVASAACKPALTEATNTLEASYTPAVQGVLDYYDREIERLRLKHCGERPGWGLNPLISKPGLTHQL